MNLITNAAEELKAAEELLQIFKLIEDKTDKIKGNFKFLTVEDIEKITGLKKPTVRKLFNRPDFPCCDYGKSKIVFAPAFYEYFMKAVKTTDFGGSYQ